MPTRRAYGQLCGLASALDVLGERWTLLVVRELLSGPARFTDVLANLPGMGPNQLSDRLRTLIEAGVVEQLRTGEDGRARSYRLTPLGSQLRGPLLGLAAWGLNLVTTATGGETRAAWSALAVEALIHGRPAGPFDEQYEFRVADEVLHVDVSGGRASVLRGPARAPAMIVTTDAETFVRVGAGVVEPDEAVAGGLLSISGRPPAIERCLALLGLDGLPAT